MMRLNLQLTMGSFSLTLFGLIGVAFGMNLTSCFEEVRQLFAKDCGLTHSSRSRWSMCLHMHNVTCIFKPKYISMLFVCLCLLPGPLCFLANNRFHVLG